MKNLTPFWNTKNYIKLLMFLGLFFAISNCRSKDDDEPIPPKVYPVEKPLAAFIYNSGINQSTDFVNSLNYESGQVFSPNVTGTINAIHVKLPDSESNLRITIWDYDTKVVLKTEVVNVTAANTIITKAITPLSLQKDKKYVISMNGNDWYNREKNPATPIAYPIVAGNITYHNYIWKSGTAQVFPTNVDATYIAGDIDFTFQQTD